MTEACFFCGQPVPNDIYAAEHVTGWVERRRGGGAHGVRLMTKPTEIAHVHCLDAEVERQKHGILKGQTNLFEEKN